MKLATFTHNGATRIGVVIDDLIVDTQDAPNIPADMCEFLAGGQIMMGELRQHVAENKITFPLSEVHLEAPVQHPQKYLAVGLNYRDHVEEVGGTAPEFPSFFNKQVTCINGPYDPIHKPRISDHLDYECELGVVIGKQCRHVPRDKATEVIAGYTICNDVSVRDWQRRSATTTLGKSWDSHGPIGPWIVTADELGDPHSLDLRTDVNGGMRQETNSKYLIHDCFDQVAYLSTVCTLMPGDIISTGTTSGVAHAMRPEPGWLKIGDKVRVTIEKLGYIENEVIAEPDNVLY
jgi:2-keto-4-pentenoate hydratase/2-oxohepta-3-ene-1,7-dioic acid hydratase in catechol pathway